MEIEEREIIVDEREEYQEEIASEKLAGGIAEFVNELAGNKAGKWVNETAKVQYDKDTVHTFSYRRKVSQ